LCTKFKYTDTDLREKVTFPGGATLNIGYDGASNTESVIGKNASGGILTSFTYSYNQGTQDRDLRQTMTQNDPLANATTTYTYDRFDRLTDAVKPGSNLEYDYDLNGNRTVERVNGTPTSYSYNSANELTQRGSTTFNYDANGNLTSSSTGDSYTYNLKNQTTAMTVGGVTLSPLVYADFDQTERTQAGSTTFAASSLGLGISKTGTSQPIYYLRDNNGNLIGQRSQDGTARHYYLKDALGSVVAVITGSGGIANRYGYDPFGKSTFKSETVTNPWQFAGGFRDPTGLYKFGTRYYDPTVGRWTQRDPLSGQIANPNSLNPYTYAACNPVNFTDPTGQITEDQLECAINSLLVGSDLFTIWAALEVAMVALAAGQVPVAIVAAAVAAVNAGFYASDIENALETCGTFE
jgi:RHS repeat-associated protein